MYFIIFLIISSLNNYIFAQNSQEYLGIIKLNDSSLISYRLNLLENNGIVSGYSITDIGGNHETKSNITGTYNKKTNLISFKEVGIIYTKSEISDYDFCYIHFSGKLHNINAYNNINGSFKGLYNDSSTCIDGEIILKSVEKIEKRVVKADKIIQKSRKINDSIKSEINISKLLDTLKMNVLKANQNLSMFSTSEKLTLKIYDAGKVDGDRISIYVNNSLLLKNYEVTKKTKELTIPLNSKKTVLKITALNVGSISPNTAKIEIIDSKNNINTLTSLKEGEETLITAIKLN